MGNIFSSIFCTDKKVPHSLEKSLRYKSPNKDPDNIRLLPMSVFPNMTTMQYFGLVDVHLIRRVWLHDCDSKNDWKNFCNGASEVQMIVDELIEDLN